ncbi:MAG: LysM peptidoglycan-binding domain-containing protein, partial [Flavobacteriales bacterium]|nr:LysM peptidoglycan-binding domain-containing protein [Flavobacteriales bacterium]
MGVINPRILAFLVFVLTSFVMMSQDKPAVHKINGKKYYLHVVEKGNTIYGIHKLYNVTVDQLMSENPVVKKEGLRVNQTLLIPVTTQNKKELGAAVQISAEYVTHQVQAKETLYSISK